MANGKIITLENLNRFHTNLLNVLSGKQDTLVSGENISSINGISLLNGGNISITTEGGGGQLYMITLLHKEV